MYTIGEFSRITSLTVKTLRFYHERGLLTPAAVDQGSGYRYYDSGNVERARIIKTLRSLDFSLEEIAEILAGCEDDGALVEHLQRRRDAVRAEVARQRDIAASLDTILKHTQESNVTMQNPSYEIIEKTVDALTVAGIRMTGRYSDCGPVFGRLGKLVGRHIAGKAMCLYYDGEYREHDADFEPCFPVRKAFKREGVTVHELPAIRCLTLVHPGPYEHLGRSYEKLLEHAKAHGHTLATPSREVYLKGPGMIFKGNPKKYLTEIQMPIENEEPAR